jgi:hypothetical protein
MGKKIKKKEEEKGNCKEARSCWRKGDIRDGLYNDWLN